MANQTTLAPNYGLLGQTNGLANKAVNFGAYKNVGAAPTGGSTFMSGMQPHPALAAASNSHPSSITTNPDGTVKASYDLDNLKKGLLNVQTGLNSLQQQQNTPPAAGTQGLSQGQQTMQNSSNPAAGAVGNVINTSNQPAPNFNQSSSGLMNIGQTGSPDASKYAAAGASYAPGNITLGQQAQNIGNTANQQIQQTLGYGANAAVGNLTTGTQPVGGGNAAIASEAASQRAQGIAAGAQQALAGNSQALTGQAQAANAALGAATPALGSSQLQQTGYQNAGNLGISQQQTQLGGQESAAGLIPQALLYGAFGGGNLSPQSVIPSLAQQVQSGQLDPQTAASIANSIFGGSGAAMLNQGLQGSGGYNYIYQGGLAAGQQQLAGQLPTLQAAVNKSGGIYNTISNFLQNNPNINPQEPNFVNAAKQWLNGTAVTDPRYSTLFNVYLPEYMNSITPVLGAAGNQTNYKTQIAQSFINPQGSSASIKSTLDNVNQAVNDALANITSAAKGGGVVAGGTSPGTPGSLNGNSYTSSSGKTYNLPY